MSKLFAIVLLMIGVMTTGSANAQSKYPEKPVHIIIGFPAGVPPDMTVRLLGQRFTETWGQPVIVENVPGVAGNIAADRVAKAPADGYTLLFASNASMVINVSLYDKLPYDPIRDFVPISQVYSTPNILVVNNSVPARNVQELIALAKAQPGKLTFASSGSGTPLHLSGELFRTMAEIDIVHIPYKALNTGLLDLLAGRVTMIFGNMPLFLPQVREGKLRPLAVTSSKRSPLVPELPTMIESGFPGFESATWLGLLAPRGTPLAIVSKLHDEIVNALKQPDIQKKFADLSMEPIGNSPGEFARAIRTEIPIWAKVVKDSGAKPD